MKLHKAITFIFLVCVGVIGNAQKAKIYEKLIPLNTYPFSDPDPVPNVGRIYPYFYFHGYTNTGKMKNWKMVVLENDYIQVFVCPDIGGKVWGAIEKSTGKEFLYFNHTAKFRDIAMRGAWTSGGLEFNFGDIGHIPTCATPVDYTTKTNDDGSVSCVVGAEDLPSGTRWSVETIVYPDKAFFETKVIWHNNTGLPVTYYHWMNAAAKADGDLEFIYPGTKHIGHGTEYGDWPKADGRDLNFYKNNNFGSYKSYHVLNAYADFFGGYWHDDDFGFGHWSNYDDKPGKKLWIWGLAPQGMIWKDLLTDHDGQYIEFQAGKLFNQAAEASTKTPFKHREFSPHDADIMSEIWFPLKATEGMVAASKYGVLNVEEHMDKKRLYLSALQPLDASLSIFSNDKEIFSKQVKLKPLELWEYDFSVNDHFTIILGDQLLKYSSRSDDIMVNRPLLPHPDFDFNTSYGFYIKGLEFEKQRKYTEAMDSYILCLKKEAAYVPALNRMAQSYLRQGNAADALKYVQQSLSVDTYDDEANYLYGLAQKKLGHLSESKSGFSIAAASVKYRSAAYTQLATIFLSENNFTKASEYGNKALKFNAANVAAMEVLAVVARKLNNRTLAVSTLESIASVDRLNPFVQYENYLLNPGKEQLHNFKNAISNELPHETYLSLALRYVELNSHKEALEILKTAPSYPITSLWQAKLDPENRSNLIQKALDASPAMVFPHRIETAELIAQLLKDHDHWKLHYYLGLIYWKLGLIEKTKSHFDLCGSKPDYGPFYLAKAKLYPSDKKMIAECISKARNLHPNDHYAAIAQIKHDLQNEHYDNAAKLSYQFLQLHPELGELGISYARALIGLKKYKEAIEFLEKYNVLPHEGATIGRQIFNEACIRAAIDAYSSKKYDAAIGYAEKAKTWPVNLGVGQPYHLDERIEDYLIAKALEKLGKTADAQLVLQKIASFEQPQNQEENARLILQLNVLREQGKLSDAKKLLFENKQKQPQNQYLKWVESRFQKSKNVLSLQNAILKSGETNPSVNNTAQTSDFNLLVEFMDAIL